MFYRKNGNTVIKISIAAFLLMGISIPSSAQSNQQPSSVSSADWQASGQDGIVALRLDGRVINIIHEQGRRYLRQGYGASRDDKRNVEASPPDLQRMPSRTKGFDWVLQDTGDGYYNIINLTTGLYLTLDSDDENNVSNWGQVARLTDHQKWRFVLSDSQKNLGEPAFFEPGTYGSFRIYNKRNNQPLTMYDSGLNNDEENVTVWPDQGPQAKGFDWALVPARDTVAEAKILKGNSKNGQNTQFRSTSLASIRRLTIEKVRAIKVSTGQDDATKALFTGIDVLVEAGIGVASGGASAAASTAKLAGRAVTKEALKSAAKAGAKKAAKKITKKSLAKDFATGLMEDKAISYGQDKISEQEANNIGLEMASVGLDILDAMGSEAIFNEVYGESPDDFYIKVNGSSIFPNGGRGHISMKSQDTRIVNKSFVFDRFDGAVIQLREYDSISSDDSLGEVLWTPYKNRDKGVWVEFDQVSALLNGKGYLSNAEREALPNIEAADKVVVDGVERYEDVLISKDSEGSLYEITYRIEPFVPAHMVLGKLHSQELAERVNIWKNQKAQLFEAEQRRLAWVAERDAKAEAEARAAKVAEAAKLAENKRIEDEGRAHNANLEAQWTADAQRLYGNCSQRGSVRSVEQSGVEALSVRMFNKGSRNVNLYWIDTQGQEVDYGSQDTPVRSIAPGPAGDVEIGTPGYWYIATDDNGECVGLGNISDFSNGFTFNPDLVVTGAHPHKAATSTSGTIYPDQSGYDDGYTDTNEYADDQSGLEQYENQSEYVDESSMQNYDESGQGPGCEYIGQIASPEGGEIITAKFENQSNQSIDLYFIDSAGVPNNYEDTGEAVISIPAQSYQMVSAQTGHIFVGGDENGACLGVAEVTYEGEVISFPPSQ